MRIFLSLIAVSLFLSAATATRAQNPELTALYQADQAARATPAEIDWNVLLPEDRKRRQQVIELMRAGAVRTAADCYHAAMVFQHGESLDDIRLAHALSTIAMSLAPEEKAYRWLTAASWDRMMSTQLQPQWYGTQYQSDDDGMFLYPIAEGAVSDDDRKAMQVPTLSEVQTQLAEMARMHGHVVDPDPPTIEELRKARLGTQPE
nr:hypothetical protein [uncultured Pseudoxanthomonas sp.]